MILVRSSALLLVCVSEPYVIGSSCTRVSRGDRNDCSKQGCVYDVNGDDNGVCYCSRGYGI